MIGPQRIMPASVAQINAQHKQVLQAMKFTPYKYELKQGDFRDIVPKMENDEKFQCVFADPPDNIGLGYEEYADRRAEKEYIDFLDDLIEFSAAAAPIVWISFNAKWTFAMGRLFDDFLRRVKDWEGKACQQVFTFGQHNKNDLGNNHRPLWRLRHKDAPLYPDAIKVPSWRQRHGDKRAAAGGRVPGDVFDMQHDVARLDRDHPAFAHLDVAIRCQLLDALGDAGMLNIQPGDVFDFPRVTGNSKQRQDWHPTQLHEDLVERCVLLSTTREQRVLDPFGGTGTTMRVCKKLDQPCTLIELDTTYCGKIAELQGLQVVGMDALTRPKRWGSQKITTSKNAA